MANVIAVDATVADPTLLGELSDEELEVVVGGLQRVWGTHVAEAMSTAAVTVVAPLPDGALPVLKPGL